MGQFKIFKDPFSMDIPTFEKILKAMAILKIS